MGLLDDAIREHLDLKRRRGADPTEVERLEREALGPVRREFPAAQPQDANPDPESWEEESPAGIEEAPSPPIVHEPSLGQADATVSHSDANTAGDYDQAATAFEDEFEDYEEPVRPVRFQPRSLRERLTWRSGRVGKQIDPERDTGRGDPFEEDSLPSERFLDEHPEEEPVGETLPGHGPMSSGEDFVEREPVEHVGQETVEYQAIDVDDDFVEGVRKIPREQPPESGQREPDPPRTVDREAHPGSPADPAGGTEPKGEDVLEETPEFLHDTPEHDRLWFEQRPPRDFDFNE